MSKRSAFFAAMALIITGVITQISYPVWAVPNEPEEVFSGGIRWEPTQEITNSANGGKLPAIATAPNGRTVMVGYIRQMSSDANDTVPYARKSSNNGESWASPVNIGVNGSAETTFMDITFDGNSVAHAVWTELTGSIINAYYAKETIWPATPAPFSSVNGPDFVITTPAITARGNQVYIVWAEDNAGTGLSEIYYRHSTNAGASWAVQKEQVVELFNVSLKPDIEIDTTGKAHLVWQKGIPPFPIEIMYSQRPSNGSWTTPIAISTLTQPDQPLTPQIVVDGVTVHVSYTNWDNGDRFQQYVHHVQCSATCTNLNNWLSTSNPVSGQVLSERSINPTFSVKSTLGQVGNCTLVYFHGIPQGSANEQVFGVSSCGNWSQSPRDVLTPSNLASINPQMAVHNGWYIYLTYEDVTPTGTRTIWFIRNDPAIYLPMIRKP